MATPRTNAKRGVWSKPLPPLPPVPWLPLLAGALSAMWVVMLGLKAYLIDRQAFHWDEFWFLSLIHAGLNGELASGLQMFHVVIFAWLPGVGDEIQQLHLGRWIMWGLLVLSTGLLYRLARRVVLPLPALVAPVAFLAFNPVAIHAAAFRADSLLLPVCLGVLLLLSRSSIHRRDLALAGVLWGVAIIVSIKAVLFAPMALCALLAARRRVSELLLVVVWVGGFALLAALACWGLLHLIIDFQVPSNPAASVVSIGNKMFSQWMPHGDLALHYMARDKILWGLLLVGFLVALVRRSPVAGFVLALAPVLFYRNAYAYYYVLMLAPAAVLAALAADAVLRGRATLPPAASAPPSDGKWALAFIACMLYLTASGHYTALARHPHQQDQQRVIRAVHQVFPTPVSYLDHSGVIASFHKANGFLSTWGIENYTRQAHSFLPPLLSSPSPPPLLLADRDVLTPGSKRFKRLFPEDRRLIAQTYLPYWGPIWIAGAKVPASGKLHIHLPGRYRLAGSSVMLDGKSYRPGDIVHITKPSALDVRWPRQTPAPRRVATLWWAAAQPPPATRPPADFFDLPR